MMPFLYLATSIFISVLQSGEHVSGHSCRYAYVCDGGLTSDHTDIIKLKKEIEGKFCSFLLTIFSSNYL